MDREMTQHLRGCSSRKPECGSQHPDISGLLTACTSSFSGIQYLTVTHICTAPHHTHGNNFFKKSNKMNHSHKGSSVESIQKEMTPMRTF